MAEKEKMAEALYTQQDVEFREDLLQKIMTCDHVIGVLVAREDSPGFIHQVKDMKQIFFKWYNDAVAEKAARVQAASAAEGDGDEPDPQ